MKQLSAIILIFISCSNLCAQKNIKNTATFCKVWGLCKYYSNTNTDWDKAFFDNYQKIIYAKSKQQFNDNLHTFIQLSLSNNQKVINQDTSVSFPILFHQWKIKDTSSIILNVNFNWIKQDTLLSSTNKKQLVQILYHYKPKKSNTFKAKAYQINHIKEKTYQDFNLKIPLLALFRAYNVIAYYYPYKSLLDVSWDTTVLQQLIPTFLSCKNINDYKKALFLMSSYIQDTHVSVAFKNKNHQTNAKRLLKVYPINVDYAEGKLFLKNILNDSIATLYHLKKGDVITKINDIPVDTLINIFSHSTGNSNKEAMTTSFCVMLLYKDTVKLIPLSKDTLLHLTLLSKDKERTIAIQKVSMDIPTFYKLVAINYEVSKEINSSVGYIYLPESTYSNIDNLFKKFKNKPYLILDCRGYGSSAAMKLARLLSRKPKVYAQYYYPNKIYPGIFNCQKKGETSYSSNTFDMVLKIIFEYNTKIFPTFNRPYQGKIIVLIDNDAMSFGETVIMIIKACVPNAKFIGRPTTGANGNIARVILPLGGTLKYSGLNYHFPDGTQLQRKGIQPDIFVPKTIKDEISGKDAILQAAINYIKKNE